MQLVLASTSARRSELLALLGLSFDVCSPTFEEQPIVGLSPLGQVTRFALEKARSVAQARPHDLVLGSDTVIELDGRLLGKPLDLRDARATLTRLAGRAHHVHSAVALCSLVRGIESVEAATATVHMKTDVNQALERYLATHESLGKAGAYSIQGLGGDLIERIDGDYTTVVGLPVKVAARLLLSAGYPVPRDVEELYQRKPYPNWSRFAA
ncbi:MAG: hypothetical protein EWM72_01129 [Nitrospira sp.]|nr:MAG: hypothetical protein EWM72_01129 [Nitrospira sp.]